MHKFARVIRLLQSQFLQLIIHFNSRKFRVRPKILIQLLEHSPCFTTWPFIGFASSIAFSICFSFMPITNACMTLVFFFQARSFFLSASEPVSTLASVAGSSVSNDGLSRSAHPMAPLYCLFGVNRIFDLQTYFAHPKNRKIENPFLIQYKPYLGVYRSRAGFLNFFFSKP